MIWPAKVCRGNWWLTHAKPSQPHHCTTVTSSRGEAAVQAVTDQKGVFWSVYTGIGWKSAWRWCLETAHSVGGSWQRVEDFSPPASATLARLILEYLRDSAYLFDTPKSFSYNVRQGEVALTPEAQLQWHPTGGQGQLVNGGDQPRPVQPLRIEKTANWRELNWNWAELKKSETQRQKSLKHWPQTPCKLTAKPNTFWARGETCENTCI